MLQHQLFLSVHIAVRLAIAVSCSDRRAPTAGGTRIGLGSDNSRIMPGGERIGSTCHCRGFVVKGYRQHTPCRCAAGGLHLAGGSPLIRDPVAAAQPPRLPWCSLQHNSLDIGRPTTETVQLQRIDG